MDVLFTKIDDCEKYEVSAWNNTTEKFDTKTCKKCKSGYYLEGNECKLECTGGKIPTNYSFKTISTNNYQIDGNFECIANPGNCK